MSWSYEASVVHRDGRDYWRTWFIEECESSGLFGINEKHLPLITKSGIGFDAYRVGTEIFLEDAPYFKGSRKQYHRVCGPYEVVSAQVPASGRAVYSVGNDVIVYKESRPGMGPWLDSQKVTRLIDGIKVHFPKIASQFGFYPYRFAIQKSRNFKVAHIAHQEGDCWLCKKKNGYKW